MLLLLLLLLLSQSSPLTNMLPLFLQSKSHFNTYFPELGDDWYFYHDALSQMTANDCRKWMIQQDYWKHWLLPIHGPPVAGNKKLNSGYNITDDNRDIFPPGNTPTYMPWDVALNKDLHDSVNNHCLLTSHIKDEDDPTKFSISTPVRGNRAYLRCLEGAPTGPRINRDTRFFIDTALSIYKSKGALVEGLGSKNYRSGTYWSCNF